MRLVAAALRSEPGDPRGNVEALTACLERHSHQVDAVVTPEAFVQGFDDLTFDPAHDLPRCLGPGDGLLAEIRAAVARTQIAAGYGYFERAGDTVYSSYAVDLPGGRSWHVYRRVSRGWRTPGSDPIVYREGTAPCPTTWLDKRVAVALCGDLWTDMEAFSHLELDLLVWPVYVSFTPRQWEQKLPAYAEQCRPFGCPTLLVNAVNPCDEDPSYGGAALFDDGQLTAVAGFDGTEQEMVVEL